MSLTSANGACFLAISIILVEKSIPKTLTPILEKILASLPEPQPISIIFVFFGKSFTNYFIDSIGASSATFLVNSSAVVS